VKCSEREESLASNDCDQRSRSISILVISGRNLQMTLIIKTCPSDRINNIQDIAAVNVY